LAGNADFAQQGWKIAITAVVITRVSINFEETNEGFMMKNLK